jgi:hypothetical protein
MARGQYSSGTGMHVEGSPNSRTWKEQAEEAAAALVETTERLEDTENRLAEIAALAAPDQEDRLERIEQQQQAILEALQNPGGPPLAKILDLLEQIRFRQNCSCDDATCSGCKSIQQIREIEGLLQSPRVTG